MSHLKQFLFVRIDDRLLHGQVALGWRHRLTPGGFWIVDDDVASDPFAKNLFQAALPEGAKLSILALQDFRPAYEAASDLTTTVLLIRGLRQLRTLCEEGFHPCEVNVGGLHGRPGAKKLLDYLYLTTDEVETVDWLLDRGIKLFAQDLPGSPQHLLQELLRLKDR
jgi:mannose/fructose/N-acetylgalactosamine-specific phosphotransferase system component IIB